MKTLIFTILALVGLSQAKLDWSKIKPNHVTVTPKSRIPEMKIVGGQEEAAPHSYPYQVLVVGETGADCGGSLITPKCVLTAAHCLTNSTYVYVIVGAHNVDEVEPSQKVFQSTNFTVHEEYNSTLSNNDIALIYLSLAVPLDDTAAVVALNRNSSSLEGVRATFTGWGKISDSANTTTPILRYMEEDIISNNICESYYPAGAVLSSNVCVTAANGKAICKGDSGGPLVIHIDGGVIQVGIASFSSARGCESASPSVFVRVSSYIDWIEKNLPQE